MWRYPNKVKHVLAEKHNWNKVTNKPDNYKSVSKVMYKVMKNGKGSSYKKSAYQKTLKVKGGKVTVTYVKLPNGKVKVSNGWVE